MIPVTSCHVAQGSRPCCANVRLLLADGQGCFDFEVPLPQARQIAAEAAGLAGDTCQHHHLAAAMVEAAGARISRVIITSQDNERVRGTVRLETEDGVRDVAADTASALLLALHLRIPIFATGNGAPVGDKFPKTDIPPVFQAALDDLQLESRDERGA